MEKKEVFQEYDSFDSRVHVEAVARYVTTPATVMVMLLRLYSAFSIWIYSNALYNTLWGTFARLGYGSRSFIWKVDITGAPRTE